MEIVLYNSSSFGGCFDYGKALFQAYRQNPDCQKITWLVPSNAALPHQQGIEKRCLPDKPKTTHKLLRQLHFLWRVFWNPILLFSYLQKAPPSWVIFNDFEQLSAVFWVPVFKHFLAKKHRFAIILHDPDRDAYPPSLAFTRFSMKQIISLMDFAIYHDFLPQKPYYQSNDKCRFIDLPHGFYPMPAPDANLLSKLAVLKKPGITLITILGNIRHEKNYHLAIEALSSLPNHVLIIAGSSANARVSTQVYKDLALKSGVQNNVFWVEKFLTEPEMTAVIEISDVILLNYAISFTSQSGILNVVAPFRKELVVSDGPSSLASLIRRFKVGELVEPGSVSSLVKSLQLLEKEEVEIRKHWDEYLEYASWEKHVAIALHTFKNISR